MTPIAEFDKKGPPQPGRPPAAPVDDHGRRLSTNAEAAAWYRTAQRHGGNTDAAVAALEAALAADRAFALAAVDLHALGGPATETGPNRLAAWERRHLDVVVAASQGQAHRAACLLREHLIDVGCDPLALAAVTTALQSNLDGEIDDIVNGLPGCHTHTHTETGSATR